METRNEGFVEVENHLFRVQLADALFVYSEIGLRRWGQASSYLHLIQQIDFEGGRCTLTGGLMQSEAQDSVDDF